ncbi:hypothetical protein LQG66_22400 [Bradyrhizobium ontarionense]|uniref:Uncharacterized protein n=1 Tax=Bradyrhizobium ontarionense TaxID=2898149 RepID=A0ABY3R5F9_9BRAD|nr:hypothetical protein [Bradyrhizobium sp. A19]UFZ02051.1 hypothetical protein LQG66_22400 [Bradyrhizobium sp. A19]
MTTPDAPPPATPPEQRSGCLAAFLFVAGVILLLPGACAVVFGYLGLQEKSWPDALTAWVVAGLAIGAGGIWLIMTAWRR